MTYEELEDKVRELESALTKANKALTTVQDELVKQRRLYEDNINNLDEDNFAANYRVQQGNRFSEIKQSADKISTQVGVFWGNTNLVSFNPESEDNAEAMSKYIGQLVSYNGKTYYYNDVKKKWERTDEDWLISQFIQTSSGFTFIGDVRVTGDMIVDNTITADKIVTNGLACTKLYKSNEADVYLEIGENDGDLSLYNNGNLVFSVYDEIAGSANLSIYGVKFITVGNGIAYPNGGWNFSGANVSGLYAVFE